MVFNDLINVRWARYLNVVPGLLNIETIEVFDHAELVEKIYHVILDLLFYFEAEIHGFSADNKVVHLTEDYYEAMDFMVLEIETWFVRSVLESHLGEEDAVDVLVPESGGFGVSL